jgi:hypothetical protein
LCYCFSLVYLFLSLFFVSLCYSCLRCFVFASSLSFNSSRIGIAYGKWLQCILFAHRAAQIQFPRATRNCIKDLGRQGRVMCDVKIYEVFKIMQLYRLYMIIISYYIQYSILYISIHASTTYESCQDPCHGHKYFEHSLTHLFSCSPFAVRSWAGAWRRS